jgi:hypothetical protein
MLCPLFPKILILVIKCCVYKVTSFCIDPYKLNGAEYGANSHSRPTVLTMWDLKFLTVLSYSATTKNRYWFQSIRVKAWWTFKTSVFICQLSWAVSRLWAGQSMVQILYVSRPALEPIQACYLVDSRAFSAHVQWTGCQADHTPPSNVKGNESNQLLGH